jgi:chromosome segregation ATPase
MFSQESKLAVLESKLSIYEELSREMLSKLESAVEKISESNNRIANILTKHDERIDQTVKTDELIIKMIEGVKDENRQDHERVLSKVRSLEEKVESLTKFRWQVGGVLAVVVVLIALIDIIVPNIVPSIPKEVIVEKIK